MSQFYIRNTGGHMNKFIITTDTTADLPADYVAEHNLGMLSLTYTIDGKTYDWEHPMDVNLSGQPGNCPRNLYKNCHGK